MAKYIVNVREVWTQMVNIEADSKEEAIKLVNRGGGTYLENALEFSHMMNEEYWTVEEDG